MKRNLKKVISLLCTFMIMLSIMLGMGGKKVNAAGIYMSISLSSSSVEIGDYVTVYVYAESSEFFSADVVLNYDSSLLEFSSNSFGSGTTMNISGTSGSGEITFRAIASGVAYVSTYTEAYNMEGEMVSVDDQGASIDISDPNETTEETTEETSETTEETTETTEEETTEEKTEEKSSETTEEKSTEKEDLSDDCSLLSLKVGSGDLYPEFSSDQTTYSLKLPEDATSVDVVVVLSDEKAEYYVSGNSSLSKGENTVQVVVTAENGAYRTYTIYVTVGEEEELKFEIDGKKFDLIEESINIEVPEGFTASEVTYKNHKLKGYTNNNKALSIICLEDEDYVQAWYLIDKNGTSADKKGELLSRYYEYKADSARYVILTKPETEEVPKGFTPAKLKIGENDVSAYCSEKDSKFYLVYASSVNGEEDWFLYDTTDKSFMRYVDLTVTEATTEASTENTEEPSTEVKTIVVEKTVTAPDKGFFSKKNLKIMLLILAAMFIAVCIVAIVLVVKTSSLTKKLNKKMRRRTVAEELEFDEDNVEEYEKALNEAAVPEENTNQEEYYADPENEDPYTEYTGDNAEYSEPEGETAAEYTEADAEVQYAEDGTEAEYTEEAAEYAEENAEEYDTSAEYAEGSYEDDSEAQYAEEAAEVQYAEGDGVEYASADADAEYVNEYSDEQYAGDETELQYSEEATEYMESDDNNSSYTDESQYSDENEFDDDYMEEQPEEYEEDVPVGGVIISSAAEDESVFSRFDKKDTKTGKPDDTIGITLEDAIDNNSNVNVPPADEISTKEEAMKTRPYGIDSAFDVVDEEDYKKMNIEKQAEVDPEVETTDISEVCTQINDENSTLNAAAAAFANIKKSIQESETVTKDLTSSQDEDIVFPSKDSDD
ncbi:Cadherin-like beta sandwich domain-containing protein [Eubacterium ruminantium]|nr:Cadherin-like beta sandwich domain-containing protein [Eubacterium ruminantium]